VVLRDTYNGGRKDLSEGEVVSVVSMHLSRWGGGTHPKVARDGETEHRFVQPNEIAPLDEGRPIAEMGVAELSERYIEIAEIFASLNARNEDYEDLFDVLHDQQQLILKGMPATPSRGVEALKAKLRFVACVADDGCIHPEMDEIFISLADDYFML
jgi:hypothetical protein